MCAQGRTRLGAEPGDDVERSRREPDGVDEFGQSHGRSRGLIGGFGHGAVARGQGRGGGTADELERIVPGHDVPGHPIGFAPGVDVHVLGHRDRLPVVGLDRVAVELEVAGADIDIGVGLGQRFAGVLGFEAGEFVAVGRDHGRGGKAQSQREH